MEKAKKQRIRADMMILLVTLFWGTSYVLLDFSLDELSAANINILRFGISFIVLFVVFRKRLLPVNKETLKYSVIIGFIVMFTYLTSTLGVKYTSLSNAGFLCSLTVVFTPIFAYFFMGEKPEKRLFVAICLAMVGIALMTLNENMTPALGDVLCILCAISYAGVLLLTETAVSKPSINPFQLGVYQVAFAGIFQLVIALPFETLRLPKSPKVWLSILALAFFCTGLAFVVQSLALQYTTASRVGIIFSLEPVFAAILAFLVAGEILSLRGYGGAALLMMSLLIMEIDFNRKPKIHLGGTKES